MTPGDGLELNVNGRPQDAGRVPDDERLLDTLRARLGLRGTKEGCRTGDCGACTVLVRGEATLSCLTLTHEVADERIETVESMESDPVGAVVQSAFEQEGAVQCGYCTPGFVVALSGRLRQDGATVDPTELLEDLQGNLCRCTGYAAIVRAVERARREIP